MKYIKKNLVTLLIVTAIIALTGVVILTGVNDESSEGNTSKLTNHDHFKHTLPEACEIFTDTDAISVLGPEAVKGESNTPPSTEDLKISSCRYLAGASRADITVKAPLTDKGIEMTESVFGKDRPAGAIDVDGYGSDAHWNQSGGVLSILREHSLIEIYAGEANELDRARAVADKVIENVR